MRGLHHGCARRLPDGHIPGAELDPLVHVSSEEAR